MIAAFIKHAIKHRVWVLLVSLALTLWGMWALSKTPLDAIPDLSDVQVIVRTSFPGQAPQIIENQVTYPLTTTMLSVPGAKVVRGYSFFGDSFVYVLFEDGTDPYWARSRVLEYLSQVQARLPAQAKVSLGPDASGVGWVYEYALVDHSGKMDLSQLRALQDWFLKFELKSIPNVAEVASIGGMVKQYQIVLDPDKLKAYRIPHQKIIEAVQKANQETGGSVLELAEAEYMVRASGYLLSVDAFRQIPLMVNEAGLAITLGDVAQVTIGPEMRRGIAELNGEGEVAGGVVIMRSGKNALATIAAVKEKIQQLKSGLPPGVEIVTTYDRSQLIQRAVHHLGSKLLEEFAVVAVVCILFLFHFRSALVAIISLPLGVLAAYLIMLYQGINANIMSLGGIAIAIGAMVDAAVVMIENAHKHIEAWHHQHPDEKLVGSEHWRVIAEAASEVGPALFFSLIIIVLSFIPVFSLEAQEGRLFAPLAFTKTYAMAAAALISITLIPVLMGLLIRGKIPAEHSNPLNRFLIRIYLPLLKQVLAFPKTVLSCAGLVVLVSLWPMSQLGSEFMPALDEGDLLYMPSALPGLSAGKAAQLLQQTDRLIKTVPEVASVFGKAGRAESATDPAPMEMFETTIQLKPKSEWRTGMTTEKLIAELDRTVQVPGLSNLWVPPIRNRIDMLATGIKSPVGIKVSGIDLREIDRISSEIEKVVKKVNGVSSALAERLNGGRYIDIQINRPAAARYGLNISDVQSVVSAAIGGENIGETVEGLQRFPINLRYPRELRDSLEKLKQLPILTERGAHIQLQDVAQLQITEGAAMLKSENARLSGWIYVDIQGRDLRSVVKDMQGAVAKEVKLTAGYAIAWSGQFEYLERASARLKIVVPVTLAIIFILLVMSFSRFDEALLIMASLPFALVGAVFFLWLLGHHVSVASGVGFIALAGLSAEFGVIMLLYLKNAWAGRVAQGHLSESDLLDAITEGAALRVRPKAMTVAVILAGLLPLMIGDGSGAEVMQRIAAPMIGGMITAPLLSMFVLPAAYLLLRRRQCRHHALTENNQVTLDAV